MDPEGVTQAKTVTYNGQLRAAEHARAGTEDCLQESVGRRGTTADCDMEIAGEHET